MNPPSPAVSIASALVQSYQSVHEYKWRFLAVFMLVLFITTTVLAACDVLPNAPGAQSAAVGALNTVPVQVSPLVAATPELPTKIEIPAISMSVVISNPESTNIAVLDEALLSGAVRYPTSAKLGEQGNVILFGHSSYLPIVNNKAFKAFDDIQKLKQGARITVTGTAHTYVYSVDTVEKASATADAIPLSVNGSRLTLATCNSFGDKSDRFVVTATLIETQAL